MLKSNLSLLGALAVLALGLTACSPDKKTDDTWSVDAPQIALKTGSKVGFTDAGSQPQLMAANWTPSFREMSHRVLPPEAEIVFSSLERDLAAHSAFALQVHAECKNGPISGVADLSFANAARVPLLALIPKNILVTTLSSAPSYSCQINLIAKNSLGSSYSFPLEVLIANTDELETLKMQNFIDRSDLPVAAVDVANASHFMIASTAAPEPVEVTLSCELYSKSRIYSDVKEFHLSDLVPNFAASDAAWRKSCRLSVHTLAQPQAIKISRLFTITTTAPKLSITRSAVSCDTAFRPTISSFQIKNESEKTQIIGMKWDNTIDVGYGSLLEPSADGDYQTRLTREVSFETGSDQTITTADGTQWIEIAAGESRDIQINIDQPVPFDVCIAGETRMIIGLLYKTRLQVLKAGRLESLAQLSAEMALNSDETSDESDVLIHGQLNAFPFKGGYVSAAPDGQSTY